MPEAVAAILLRIPFMAASGFVMAFGKKVSLLIRVGTCFITTAGPSVAAAWAPYRENPEKEFEPTLLVSLFVAIFAGYLSAFASLKKKKLGISVQAITVGTLAATWGEAFAISGYDMSDYRYTLPWFLLFYKCCVSYIFIKVFLKNPNFRDMARCAMWCCWCCCAFVGAGVGGVCWRRWSRTLSATAAQPVAPLHLNFASCQLTDASCRPHSTCLVGSFVTLQLVKNTAFP